MPCLPWLPCIHSDSHSPHSTKMQSMTQTHTHTETNMNTGERTEVTQQQSSNNNKEGRGTASTPESTKNTHRTHIHTSGDGHIAKHKK